VSGRIGELVSKGEKDGSAPFPRQVDAWWMAMSIGVRQGRRTPLPERVVKFNDGGILSSDPWRITQLELLTLSLLGAEALDSPSQTIRMASEFANTGFDWLLETVLGQAEPTLALINAVEELFGS
jgi:hypothetical protein